MGSPTRAGFKWASGSHSRTIQAKTAGQRLLELKAEHGKLTRQIVLDDARPEDSVLHDYFEWDDSIAGEEYRLEQARYLIRTLKVTVIRGGKPYTQRAFHAIVRNEERTFEDVATVLGDDDLRAQLLQQVLADIRSFQKKYADLEEVAPILVAMQAAMPTIARKVRRRSPQPEAQP